MRKIIYALMAFVVASCGYGLTAKTSSNKSDVAQNLQIFNALTKELQTNYVDTIDATKTVRYAIDAMLSRIDPYTEYYSIDEQDDYNSLATGEFGGIGCVIMQRDGKIVLSSPNYGTPSRKAGVRHGDVLVAIDGDTLPTGFTSAEASKRLRGQAGSKLTITVQRPYVSDSLFDIEITRGIIKTEAVPYYGILRDGIGYIRLTQFTDKSADKVRDAVTELSNDPALKGIILDLRNNGGGLLEAAVDIVGNFVPKGTHVLSTKGRDESNEKKYTTPRKPIDTKVPVVVLINGNTASAAEIVSGALQDLDRAVIIGERSYGKGLVQSSRPLPYDGVLKVTIARYYIPSGRLIQAIDYSHRNPDGSVARIPDSLTNVFHTAGGREVRDGGGITPDIKTVYKQDADLLIYTILSDNWVFDFANRFANTRTEPMPDAGDFVVTDSIFNDFKAFIDPSKFKYNKPYENMFKTLREAAEVDGYLTDSVNMQIELLEKMLEHDLYRDLDHKKAEIIEILDDEISERYYSDADKLLRSFKYDADIDSAISVLSDPARYNAILRPSKATNKK